MAKQVVKKVGRPFIDRKAIRDSFNIETITDEGDVKKVNKNKKQKKETMTNEEILAIENAANSIGNVKVVKKDRGLIERTESSKVVLTEDNRQVLGD